MVQILPKIIAFDLDATLWVPEMYELSGPPFKKDAKNPIYLRDGANERIHLMGDSREILKQLAIEERWRDTSVAYVSRTEYPQWAKQCLKLFHVHEDITMDQLGEYFEIYPGSKKKHFRKILQQSGLLPEEILFFDNEQWNITDVAPMDICSVYTPRGMTMQVWQEGLKAFQEAAIARQNGEEPKLAIGSLHRSFW